MEAIATNARLRSKLLLYVSGIDDPKLRRPLRFVGQAYTGKNENMEEIQKTNTHVQPSIDNPYKSIETIAIKKEAELTFIEAVH